MALNHIALTVRDRERSGAFYGEHFGLVDRVHDDDHLLILSGRDGGLLALGSVHSRARKHTRPAAGCAHRWQVGH
jgi:catechol 2,3-dioxygenase-like lactoylglutathione lyase family enzyme